MLSPTGTPPLKQPYWWVADRAMMDRLIGPELNAFRRELGLPPVTRIMTGGHSRPRRAVLAVCDAVTDWPPATRLTGFPLLMKARCRPPPDVQTFLDSGEPPIVFMPGSLMQQAEAFFEAAVASCQALGARAILLSRYAQQIPAALPQGIRHFSYIPFRQILSRVRLLVHHGGIGTCAQALRAGVPQLIHPMAYDQHDNAWRLRNLGVGDWLLPKDWRVPALVDKLRTLSTSDDVRAHCQEVAGRFEGTDPLGETCELIEGLG